MDEIFRVSMEERGRDFHYKNGKEILWNEKFIERHLTKDSHRSLQRDGTLNFTENVKTIFDKEVALTIFDKEQTKN